MLDNRSLSPAEQVALESLLGSANNQLNNILFSMGGMESDSVFRPVRCSEADIDPETGKPSVNGFLYFTTDTKKIYLGVAGGQYLMMGGSSGVYYGTRQLTDDEKYGDQVFFSFTPEEIDGGIVPATDDLILNIPDGGFYRVLEVSNTDIQTQRLVIAGGGGGSGSGPGGITNEGSLVVNFVTPQYSSTVSNQEYYIEFDIVAKDSAGDFIAEEGLATWKINGKQYTQKVRNGRNSFRVDEYLDSSIDENKLILVVNMTTGGSSNTIVSKTWYVKAINLVLDWPWTYSEQEYRSGDTFTLKFTPYGNIACQAHISFDGSYDTGYTYFVEDIPANKTGREYTTSPITVNPDKGLGYGVHSCEIWLTADINGETHSTDVIRHEITITKGGTSTILTVPYYGTSATQYDTVNIPFLVYDPDTEFCNVSFYVNDVRISGDSYDRSLHYWPYTLTDFGSVRLSLRSDNGDTYKDIELVVNKLDIPHAEATGAAFSLKATAFSSNDELRNWNSNGVTLTFSDNFDWSRGGIGFETMADGSIEKFIRVRQGTRMWINYKLFENFTTGVSGGKNFKFCFKATNCYDYEASVLKCINGGVGVEFDAQKAKFATSAYPNFATQYCENSYVEVETEIWPKVDDKVISDNATIYGDRFLMIWVDGVPAGVKPYSTSMSLTQVNPQIIEIGSDLCDVLVYCAKAYERKLSFDEHLDNFIMDAPSSAKMIERFRRNDIMDNNNEISYEKLVQANPGCHAYLYDIPKMTTSKNTKIDGCTYYELIDDYDTIDNPYIRAEKVRTYVQGTSSAAYGVAAFNLRSDFTKKGKVYNAAGEEMTGWQRTPDDLPIDIACTKVNVASCENANNVVNQEWYNKFQPYWDAHRRKGYKVDDKGNALYNPYRDTMGFHSGVIFIRDHNTNDNYLNENGEPKAALALEANVFFDDDRYMEEVKKEQPYFKMYSIGNMGNDKKNINVFHDITNPRAACVEVADNQNAEHWMTVVNEDAFEKKVIGYDKDGKEITEGPYYEFRYGVVENDDMADNEQGITEESQRADFMRFVSWMAHNDPHPYDAELHPFGYTGNKLIDEDGNDAPVTFSEDFVFQGFDPPGYEGKPNPTGISLKGQKITKYKKTYTHDTKEYRIAKMLYECEDYMVMDSVVFHYLYILRHTMVDNVAKNTFWSTEDGLHWDLTKDYDNDTADGNDNTGNLTYTYGLEYGDLNSDGKDVFNATPSVWIAFIHELYDAQQYLYNELEKKGAWNPQHYLAEFKKHQDIIPERCWLADYQRKYLRPRQLGLDQQTYLDRLEGGRKTHQRTQFETYQGFYINSKYVASTDFSDSGGLEFRLNKNPAESWDPNNVLPISFYIDCYATIHLGGQKKTSGRLKRKQIYNAPVGQMVEAPSDATCYVYGASMIQSMSGFDKLYPGYAKLNGASKLLSVELGSDAEGYYNARLTKVDAGSNTMLQKFQMRNSGTIEGQNAFGALALDRAARLNELLLSGSAVKELSLAEGASTEILELNALKVLTLKNLLDLKTIRMDDGIYDSIEELYIGNCPKLDTYTYDFAKRPQLKRYHLNDFHWTIRSTGEDYELSNDFALSANGAVESLLAVDNLMDDDTAPKDGTSPATALVGTITIDVPCTINEYDLYEKYIVKYPNLLIEYGPNTTSGAGYQPAAVLTFMKSADSLEEHYRVLGKGVADSATLAHLVSANGPTQIAMKTPSKEPTASETFEFTGYWIDKATGTKYYMDKDFPADTIHPASAVDMNEFVPLTSMTFYPEWITAPRKYPVRFYDWEGKIIPQKVVTYTTEPGIDPITGAPTTITVEHVSWVNEWLVEYGQVYDGPIKNFHYRDSSEFTGAKEKFRWSFQGWSHNKYGDTEVKNPEYVDVTTLVVKNTVLLYGHYLTEDCTKVASKMEYFIVSGGTLNLNPDYTDSIAGKITIPAYVNGVAIKSVGGFGGASGITHVYFQEGSVVDTIAAYAFSAITQKTYGLEAVYLPATVRTIGESAFDSQINMKTVTLNDNITTIDRRAFCSYALEPMQYSINELPANLTTLGMSAFQNGGAGLVVTKIPSGLKVINSYTFTACPNVKISEFGGSLTTIYRNAFNDAGNGGLGGEVTEIYIKRSVTEIGLEVFLGYATNTLTNAYFENSLGQYSVSVEEMGLDPTRIDITDSFTG